MSADYAAQRYLIDSWRDWALAEGVPIHEGASVDVSTITHQPWTRIGDGCRAALLHLTGRGDFLALLSLEIAPGASTKPSHHMFDEIYFVRSGAGAITLDNAPPLVLAQHALFSPRRGRGFSIRNTSAHEPLRLACLTNLPFLMNFFRSEKFLFDNPLAEANVAAMHVVADVGAIELADSPSRGPGFRKRDLSPDNSILHAHVSEIPACSRVKARRHGQGTHILPLSDIGYTLVFREDAQSFERFDWRAGLVLAPGDDMFMQHFNTGARPARYLVLSLGSESRPLLERKVERIASAHLSINAGGTLIEYADQPPEIHRTFTAELARKGLTSRMPTIAAVRR